jgi:hypothetical protein
VTKSAGHATEIGYSIDLSKYDGFACCSGDGLLWEALQGVLRRKDWRYIYIKIDIEKEFCFFICFTLLISQIDLIFLIVRC